MVRKIALNATCSNGLKNVLGERPEKRGDGSSDFEPLVRVGSSNFQIRMWVGHPVL